MAVQYDLSGLSPELRAQCEAAPMFHNRTFAKLLTVNGDAKTSKGEKIGVRTAILYLAPSLMSGQQVCPMAKLARCEAGCLNTAGRGAMSSVQLARLRKTLLLQQDPAYFWSLLKRDLDKHVRACKRDGVTPAVRLNGTSDIRWEAKAGFAELMKHFATEHGVRFYDYTKIANRDAPSWYDLTFSYSGAKGYQPFVEKAMARGMRIAVVFRDRASIPAEFLGMRCVDGDDTDVRFVEPQGVVVALYAKGSAKADTSGFVVG